jgi:predicted transcriptional regulator of viral defense system
MWYFLQNITLKMITHHNRSIIQKLEHTLAKGAYGFSKQSLHYELPDFTDIAIKRSLNRLSNKGKIISLYKGYYLIIPPQYAAKGILPPQLFLDSFMKHLKRPYYVALLNAAAFHGASHQQPQEYFVMTDFPALRPTQKKGLRINYISIKEIPELLIEKRKTEAGYMNVSNPALTACDLIQFEKRIGGLNRVATVLNELADAIKPSSFTSVLIKHAHVTTLQRLGYLLENVCLNQELADSLYDEMEREKLSFFRVPLKVTNKTVGFSADKRWKVIINTEIETDE